MVVRDVLPACSAPKGVWEARCARVSVCGCACAFNKLCWAIRYVYGLRFGGVTIVFAQPTVECVCSFMILLPDKSLNNNCAYELQLFDHQT